MQKVKIGLLGLGTVGSGVIEIIQRRKKEWIERYGILPVVKKILVRSIDKHRNVKIEPELLTTDAQEIIHDPEIEVIVEVMGGEEPALSLVKEALKAGKHLVTANKLMLALHGPSIFELAREQSLWVAYEAAVGGGIPIIQPLQDSLTANTIESIMGIINGTTNYILTAMIQNGEGYYDVLERAQAFGYAEVDPSTDVGGWDACYKLSVLTGVVFGEQVPVKEIPTTGITKINLTEMNLAQELGYTIKLVATAKRKGDEIFSHVHPTLLPLDHPLANVQGVNNALFVKGDAVGEVMFYGPGAGMMPTGSAVASDLIRVCRWIGLQDELFRNGEVGNATPTLPLLKDRFPSFDQKQLQGGDTNRYFLTVQTVEKPNVSKLDAKLDQTGLPIENIIIKDADNLHVIGIMCDQCSQVKLKKLIQLFESDPRYRQINYYYVEGAT